MSSLNDQHFLNPTALFRVTRISNDSEEQIQLAILQPESVQLMKIKYQWRQNLQLQMLLFCEDLQEVEHQPFQLIVLFDTLRMNIMKVDTDRKIELGCKIIVIVLEIVKPPTEEFDK